MKIDKFKLFTWIIFLGGTGLLFLGIARAPEGIASKNDLPQGFPILQEGIKGEIYRWEDPKLHVTCWILRGMSYEARQITCLPNSSF